MNATSFRLLKRSHAILLAQQADAFLARWAGAWMAAPDSAISCAAASEQAGAATGQSWRAWLLADGAAVWAASQPGLERQIEQWLFKLHELDASAEKHHSSPLAGAVAQDALDELVAGLIEALAGQPAQATALSAQAVALSALSAPPARLFRRGSGAIVCSVALGDKTVRLLLPLEALPAQDALPQPARPRLASLRHALAKVEVRLSVEVSRAELTLGYLRTLAVGDVLALPTSVEQPVRVLGPGDTTVCHAHLGSQQGFHAVALIKP